MTKKQKLFFDALFILAILLILPRISLAVILSPDATPMKIDVIKETDEGEKENSVERAQNKIIPTATSVGSVKAEVKPVLVETKKSSENTTEINSQSGQTVILVAPIEVKPALEKVIENNKNSQVNGVEVNGSNIKINYAQAVKLFGFLPMKTNLEFSTNVQNKKVEVKTPWWLFFASSNTTQVKNQIQAEVNKETIRPLITTTEQVTQTANVLNNILKTFLSLEK